MPDPTFNITGKIARKYMAHYVDTNFGVDTASYYRIGKDLEEYTVALNPDVTVFKNIIGETNMTHNGYERGGSVEPYYCEVGDALFDKLQGFVDTEPTDDTLKTTVVEVELFNETTAGSGVFTAYRQPCYIVPTSYGGDTSGYQIPFDIHYVGDRVAGTFTLSTKTFTPS